MDELKRSYDLLRNALDASYERHQDQYESIYGDNRKEFYYDALKNMCNGNFGFITSNNNYRDDISMDFNNIIYNSYSYATRTYARHLGNIPNTNQMIDTLKEKFQESYEKDNSRNFEENAMWLDEQLSKTKISKRKKILEKIIFDDVKRNKKEQLYNMDKFELIVLLTENAYRIFHICNNVTGNWTINLFNENNKYDSYDSNRIPNYENGRQRVMQLFSGFEDVATFIKQLDNEQIKQLINLYVISRNDRQNITNINMAYTINPNEMTISVSNQFKDLNLFEKVYNSRTY